MLIVNKPTPISILWGFNGTAPLTDLESKLYDLLAVS